MVKLVNLTQENTYDVYIGRGNNGENHMNNTEPGDPGWLGNPYKVGQDGSREEVIQKFEDDFLEKIEDDEEFREAVHDLQGKVLGCFCVPKPCHGEVILNYLIRQEVDEQ